MSALNSPSADPRFTFFFYFHTSAAWVYFDPDTETMHPLPFYARFFFYAQLIQGLSGNTDPGFFVFFFSPFIPPSPCSSPGKSVVSESEDEVQAAEVGGGGLRVAAEEEGIASHKPVETGD